MTRFQATAGTNTGRAKAGGAMKAAALLKRLNLTLLKESTSHAPTGRPADISEPDRPRD